MRIPRFRIRTLVIAVAVVGVGFALLVRRRDFQQRCWYESALAWDASSRATNRYMEVGAFRTNKANERIIDPALERDEQAQQFRRLVDFHDRLAGKYEHAARYPWLPVPPDPPPP